MKTEVHQYFDIIHDLYLTEPEKQTLVDELIGSLDDNQLLDLLFLTVLSVEKKRTSGQGKIK